MNNPNTCEAFERKLRERVHTYFVSNGLSKKANTAAWIKTWILLITWLATLTLLYLTHTTFAGYILLYLLHGLAALLVIFNISHDAVHQTLSSKKWINNAWGYTFNLVGGNNYSWYLKHNLAHHGATNIHQHDLDIETGPLFRVSPHSRHYWHYRFQHLYVLPLYCLLSLLLLLVMDFKAMSLMGKEVPAIARLYKWINLLAGKLIYTGYIIVLPVYLLPITPVQVLVCFGLMHALLGLAISLVLLPSHFMEPVQYYQPPATAALPSSWTIHQLLTTVDIAPRSRLANELLGGLNANVIHHIFPAIHHCHFVPLVKILQTTAGEHNIPYHSYSLANGIKQHFAYLKKMGQPQSYTKPKPHHDNKAH